MEMLNYPQDLRYLDTHEYVRLEGEIATIGLSSFALDQLGDIVFVELPEVGDAIKSGDNFGTIESVKAVESLISPVSGTVIERNDAAINSPDLICEDPYGDGWFLKVRMDDPEASLAETLTADQYEGLVQWEED